MEMQTFIDQFTQQFDEPETITAETEFKNLDSWSSLVALSVIAMADEEYNVKLTGNDIRGAVTVQDLFDKIKSAQN